MPTQRLPFPEIQSWTPAVDPRASENGNLFVLSGRNYAFDSKGLVSPFGASAINGGTLDSDLGLFQSLDLDGHVVVIGPSALYDLRESAITVASLTPSAEYWYKLGSFTRDKDYRIGQDSWSEAYVGYKAYICHAQHGIYQLNGDTITAYSSTGTVESPLAITESNGRLIILNPYQVSWSAPFDGTNLTPELGGAGFQIIAERVPGKPVTVTAYPGGFIVWTTKGVMLSEYVGGEAVFRHTRIETDQLILSQPASVVMPDGTLIFATQQGLFKTSNQSTVQPLDPAFNEFLRSVFVKNTTNHVSLYFSLDFDMLFVQVMNEAAYFTSTYVYSLTLAKWGEFSTPHRGICKFSKDPGDLGYVAVDGQPYRFTGQPYNVLPSGELTGLDSFVELGYFRLPAQLNAADTEFEIQEIVTSVVESYPTGMTLLEEDWDGSAAFVSWSVGFYGQDENWNAYGVADFDEDLNDTSSGIDYNNTGITLDLSATIAGLRDFDWNQFAPAEDWSATPDGGVDTSYIIDWGLESTADDDEDWNGPQALINDLDYGILVESSFDGYDQTIQIVPELSLRKTKTDLWTLMTSGVNHKLFIKANQPWQKYHIKQLSVTVGYQGQTS